MSLGVALVTTSKSFGLRAEQQVADAAADQVGGVIVAAQALDDLGGVGIYRVRFYLHSRLGVPHQRREITGYRRFRRAPSYSDGGNVASGSSGAAGRRRLRLGLLRRRRGVVRGLAGGAARGRRSPRPVSARRASAARRRRRRRWAPGSAQGRASARRRAPVSAARRPPRPGPARAPSPAGAGVGAGPSARVPRPPQRRVVARQRLDRGRGGWRSRLGRGRRRRIGSDGLARACSSRRTTPRRRPRAPPTAPAPSRRPWTAAAAPSVLRVGMIVGRVKSLGRRHSAPARTTAGRSASGNGCDGAGGPSTN